MSFDKFKKEYIPLVKNFDCGNVVINNFLNSENALDFNMILFIKVFACSVDYVHQIVRNIFIFVMFILYYFFFYR